MRSSASSRERASGRARTAASTSGIASCPASPKTRCAKISCSRRRLCDDGAPTPICSASQPASAGADARRGAGPSTRGRCLLLGEDRFPEDPRRRWRERAVVRDPHLPEHSSGVRLRSLEGAALRVPPRHLTVEDRRQGEQGARARRACRPIQSEREALVRRVEPGHRIVEQGAPSPVRLEQGQQERHGQPGTLAHHLAPERLLLLASRHHRRAVPHVEAPAEGGQHVGVTVSQSPNGIGIGGQGGQRGLVERRQAPVEQRRPSIREDRQGQLVVGQTLATQEPPPRVRRERQGHDPRPARLDRRFPGVEAGALAPQPVAPPRRFVENSPGRKASLEPGRRRDGVRSARHGHGMPLPRLCEGRLRCDREDHRHRDDAPPFPPDALEHWPILTLPGRRAR